MEEDSTPEAAADDGLDLSGEDSQDADVDTSADSGDDDDTSDSDTDDNAPSDADDESGDDDKSTTDKKTAKAPAFDKDIDAWAEKRGYGTDLTDRERRIAQDARNSQREVTKSAEAKKAADKISEAADKANPPAKDDKADPQTKRLDALERTLMTERDNRRISDYVTAMATTDTPVTEADVDAISNLLEKTLKTDGKAGVDFLLKDISRLHKLAQLDLGTDKVDTEAVSEKAKKEERARIEKKTKAAGPSRSAKNTVTSKTKDEVADIWADDSI